MSIVVRCSSRNLASCGVSCEADRSQIASTTASIAPRAFTSPTGAICLRPGLWRRYQCEHTRSRCSSSNDNPRKPLPSQVSAATDGVEGRVELTWQGSDDFSALGDRRDEAPLPLPPLTSAKRVVLVRHGQSTWNAEGRIQGSSNFSVLTQRGEDQAQTTRQMLSGEQFCCLLHSPLERARRTAEVIWDDRQGQVVVLPSLREIDLYSFQGLLKAEGKQRFGDAYKLWKKRSDEFEIDGHAPVRELWYRASLAWRDILSPQLSEAQTLLLVAHNAVNQALICTALGLPPSYFRRLVQSNAAVTVLDFQPGGGRPVEATAGGAAEAADTAGGGVGSDYAPAAGPPPRVTVDRLNQSPGLSFSHDSVGRGASAGRVVLVRCCATPSMDSGLLPESGQDERLSAEGQQHAEKIGELLMDMQVHMLLSSPAARALSTAKAVAQLQRVAANGEQPLVQVMEQLQAVRLGSWEGRPMAELRRQGLPSDAEPLDEIWQRTAVAWQHMKEAAAAVPDGLQGGASEGGVSGSNVVVVSHALVHAALVCHCLCLPQTALARFRKDPGGVTIIDFPDGAATSNGVVRCLNYTAHLGRSAVPITRDDYDAMCTMDSCF